MQEQARKENKTNETHGTRVNNRNKISETKKRITEHKGNNQEITKARQNETDTQVNI